MRFTFKTVLVAMLAVFALSAVAAGAAQAEEAPFFKIAGTRLGFGESKEATLKSGKLDLDFGIGTVECSVKLASGAKLLGSHAGEPGLFEGTLEFSGCEAIGPRNCKLSEPLTSSPLKGRTMLFGEKSKVGLLLEPKKGVTFFPSVKLTGTKCETTFGVTGQVAAELRSGGKTIEVGKEPAEAKTVELNFPTTHITKIWKITAGIGKEESVEELEDAPWGPVLIQPGSGVPTLELAGSPSWGVFD